MAVETRAALRSYIRDQERRISDLLNRLLDLERRVDEHSRWIAGEDARQSQVQLFSKNWRWTKEFLASLAALLIALVSVAVALW